MIIATHLATLVAVCYFAQWEIFKNMLQLMRFYQILHKISIDHSLIEDLTGLFSAPPPPPPPPSKF